MKAHLTDLNGNAGEGLPDADGTEDGIDDGSLNSDGIHEGLHDLNGID